VAEIYLRFSPRVQFREPNLYFIDIGSTAHFFKRSGFLSGEEGLLRTAVELTQDFGFLARAAISDTAAGAQAFAQLDRDFVCPPGEEAESLRLLPLPLLLHLEGLQAWERPRQIEHIVAFFYMLGFEQLGDLYQISLNSFVDRWGELGKALWRRLHGLEREVISPFLPTEPLKEYGYFDFSVSLTSLLLHSIQQSLQRLFARLQGQSLFARRLSVILHCEYSQTQHRLEIEPRSASRDLALFMQLLEHRTQDLNLENPIREFEIEVLAEPEKIQQMDFFEPRSNDLERLEALMSLLKQAGLQAGNYVLQDAVLPEETWSLSSETNVPAAALLSSTLAAPRPTRLLKQPLRLSHEDLRGWNFLSRLPVERLEDAWWRSPQARDYYLAVSSSGQCAWLFQNLLTKDYFLHGYFD